MIGLLVFLCVFVDFFLELAVDLFIELMFMDALFNRILILQYNLLKLIQRQLLITKLPKLIQSPLFLAFLLIILP